MKIRCPICKQTFEPPERGRPQRFCSAACRQKAYRKRAARPTVLKLWQSDFAAHKAKYRGKRSQNLDEFMQEREAEKAHHVKALEDLGYEVTVKRRKPAQGDH